MNIFGFLLFNFQAYFILSRFFCNLTLVLQTENQPNKTMSMNKDKKASDSTKTAPSNLSFSISNILCNSKSSGKNSTSQQHPQFYYSESLTSSVIHESSPHSFRVRSKPLQF